jgi:hypothetical protein
LGLGRSRGLEVQVQVSVLVYGFWIPVQVHEPWAQTPIFAPSPERDPSALNVDLNLNLEAPKGASLIPQA